MATNQTEDELTQSRVQELFDYSDGFLFWKISPANSVGIGDRAGCIDKKGYIIIRIKGKGYKEHRLIFLYHHGYFPEQLDHINRIKTDNRIENLREATRSQNQWNKPKQRKKCSSVYKGVSWDKASSKWRSQIEFKGIKTYLGIYLTEEKAAEAYNKAAIEFFGKYTNLNKIKG